MIAGQADFWVWWHKIFPDFGVQKASRCPSTMWTCAEIWTMSSKLKQCAQPLWKLYQHNFFQGAGGYRTAQSAFPSQTAPCFLSVLLNLEIDAIKRWDISQQFLENVCLRTFTLTLSLDMRPQVTYIALRDYIHTASVNDNVYHYTLDKWPFLQWLVRIYDFTFLIKNHVYLRSLAEGGCHTPSAICPLSSWPKIFRYFRWRCCRRENWEHFLLKFR